MLSDAAVHAFLAPCLRRARPTVYQRLLPVLALAAALLFSMMAKGADFNAVVLAQIQSMPHGGSYAASRVALEHLTASVAVRDGALSVQSAETTPSFCSGATYLIFLKTIEALPGSAKLDSAALETLLIRGQPDGHGVWGRWNANGPGTARLFYEAGLGRNFDDMSQARPGDFMKIFWTSEVGGHERGHSVIFLGYDRRDGVDTVRFWSSNLPGGYGEKTVLRAKIAYAIFSRLEHPDRVNLLSTLPRMDPYLSRLNTVRSTIPEARSMAGM